MWIYLDPPYRPMAYMAKDTGHIAFDQYVHELLREHGTEKGAKIIEVASAHLAEAGGGTFRQWVQAIQWAIYMVDGQTDRPN